MASERTEYRHKAKAKLKKEAQDTFHTELPESERNPNQLEDFEALLLKAVTTVEGKKKPTRKRGKNSKRDKSIKVKRGLF